MTKMRDFRTYQLSVQFYHLTKELGLTGALREQLQRAASSISLNLAEGSGKPSLRDQLKYFHIAQGSLRECQAILTLEQLENTEAWSKLDSLGAHLYKLIRNAR